MDPTNPSKGGKVIAADGHEYHKSSSAGAKEAPTSGTTQSAEEQAKKSGANLSEKELDFVTLVDMHWGLTGTLLSPAVGLETYNLPIVEYNECFKSDLVKAALAERGIRFKLDSPTDPTDRTPTWQDITLQPMQLIVANVMLDYLDTRSDRKKLQDLGVSTKTYQSWMRQPEFRNYLHLRAESMVNTFDHEANMALMDKIRSGDVKAIAYWHEYTGKFSLRPNADGTTGGITADSVRTLIQTIIEIIIEEVEDADTGERIGNRIHGLIAARNTANDLVGTLEATPIVQPEIMPGRVITDEMRGLMHKGVGVE